MKTSIQFINHASVIIKNTNISLLSDPWYQGDAFHKGWNLLCEISDDQIIDILNKVTHIWISHEHPDHFSVSFFKKFSKQINERNIKILFQDTKDKRVIQFLEKLSFEYVELSDNVTLKLDEGFSVTCIKDGFYDSALLVNNKDERILNLNDCDVTNPNKAKEIFSKTGEVDVLLTQFSYAAWKGGVANKKWRVQAALDKLNTIDLQISTFRPKFVIPFASFVYFSNKENLYLNDAINKPNDVVNRFKESRANIIIMKPNDLFGGDFEDFSNKKAIEFWNQQYSDISGKKINAYEKINYEVINKSFINYCARISMKNNMNFIAVIRSLCPIPFFKPVIVNILDLNTIVKFDYVSKKIEHSKEPPMICLNSESLNFLFNNSFGFDTLTVNGCFEEGRVGGFVAATKSLAIENLNNLGIFVTPSLIFNFSIIKKFMVSLYRVARKINL
jgi:L-ascorbate metabolism protein UlaG (beta-lactamase superfamily)